MSTSLKYIIGGVASENRDILELSDSKPRIKNSKALTEK